MSLKYQKLPETLPPGPYKRDLMYPVKSQLQRGAHFIYCLLIPFVNKSVFFMRDRKKCT